MISTKAQAIMREGEITVPPELYGGCGKAWVAVNEQGAIVGVRYMGGYPLPRLADLGRKRMTQRARTLLRDVEAERFQAYRLRCREELALLGEVVSGEMSCMRFYPTSTVLAAKIVASVRA